MAETPPSNLRAFLRELKRRHVVRVAIVYTVVGVGALQIASDLFPALRLPEWTVTFTAILVLLGLPIALVLAWAFEVTPDGVARAQPTGGDGLGAAGAGHRRRRGLSYLGIGALIGLIGVGLSTRVLTRPWLPGGTGADPVRSIAVLPFMNLSTDAENEAFTDGLTEELLNVLAQVKGLRVPARTSSFAFKNVNHDITEIGHKLNVEVVVEGSVRKSGDRVRITAQLINVADGAHLWSDTFDRELADVFKIQEEIAQAIVAQLLPRFGRGDTDLVRPTTTNMAAYQAYLQGRHQFWQQSGEQGLRRAAAFFEVALEHDPRYALAWAGLSDAYMLLGGSGFVPPHDIFGESKAAALKALELDDRLAEAYVALASINWLYDWDWAAADRNYRLSFSVNPLLHTRCICYAWYLAVTGNLDAAVLEAERARSLDPLARLPIVISSWMYYLSGRHDDARLQLDELFRLNASDGTGRRITAWMDWDAGRRREAIATLEKMRADVEKTGAFADRGPPIAVADLATMYARTGRQDEARQFAEQLEVRAQRQYIPPEYIAAIHGALGDFDVAFRWLERAFVERSNIAQFDVLPLSEPLRGEARYRAFLRRIGLPERAS